MSYSVSQVADPSDIDLKEIQEKIKGLAREFEWLAGEGAEILSRNEPLPYAVWSAVFARVSDLGHETCWSCPLHIAYFVKVVERGINDLRAHLLKQGPGEELNSDFQHQWFCKLLRQFGGGNLGIGCSRLVPSELAANMLELLRTRLVEVVQCKDWLVSLSVERFRAFDQEARDMYVKKYSAHWPTR